MSAIKAGWKEALAVDICKKKSRNLDHFILPKVIRCYPSGCEEMKLVIWTLMTMSTDYQFSNRRDGRCMLAPIDILMMPRLSLLGPMFF